MKKVILITFAVIAALLLVGAVPAAAHDHGHGGHEGHRGHDGGHGHFFFGVGPGPWWGPYPYYYPYTSYPAPDVIGPQTQTYIQQAPQSDEQNYWYYCTSAQGYYPYIKRCPGGWLKVVPPTTPGD